jgi:hypothetical protein
MYNCLFSFANNYTDYKNLKNKNIDFIFTNKNYGEKCIYLNKNISLFECFLYFKNYNKKFDFYLYFSSKSQLSQNINNILNDDQLYLNYYNDTIYFLKYDYNLYYLYELYKNDLDLVFINFLSDYFSCFKHNINKSLFGKIIFPKNRFLYNAYSSRQKYSKLNKRSL